MRRGQAHDDPVIVKVRCSGTIHRIELRRGRLRFLDHKRDGMLDEAHLREAAGLEPHCRCARILITWRLGFSGLSVALPDELRPARRNGVDRRSRRHSERAVDRTRSLRERLRRRVIERAENALLGASYRHAKGRWAGGDHSVVVTVSRKPDVTGEGKRTWSKNGKWSGNNSRILVTLPVRWLRIDVRGLALIRNRDGRWLFVLDLPAPTVMRPADRKRGLIEAVVIKQSRGFALKPRRALIEPKAKRLVKWL